MSHFHQCDTPRCPLPDAPGTVAAFLHAEERAAFRPLLVDLVAFVDDEHEYRDAGCHPRPGVDCYDWCDACKLIARVPADVLAEARQVLRERGIERDRTGRARLRGHHHRPGERRGRRRPVA